MTENPYRSNESAAEPAVPAAEPTVDAVPAVDEPEHRPVDVPVKTKGAGDVVKVNAKAAAGWVAGIVLNMIAELIEGRTPWPSTGAEWGRYALASFGTAIAVWATGNKQTKKQIEKALPKLPPQDQAAIASTLKHPDEV